jgi:hypothetical protein
LGQDGSAGAHDLSTASMNASVESDANQLVSATLRKRTYLRTFRPSGASQNAVAEVHVADPQDGTDSATAVRTEVLAGLEDARDCRKGDSECLEPAANWQ